MKRTIAVVPARSGSKGFRNKNIAKLNGKTLLELAVGVARDCEHIDEVIVSTDSPVYESIATAAGATSFGLRRPELSGDTVKSIAVVLDLLESMKDSADVLVLLQPTSPLRTPKEISDMVQMVQDQDVDAVVSLSRVNEPHPYKLKTMNDDGDIRPFIEKSDSEIPRQLLPQAFRLSGSIYVNTVSSLLSERTFLPEKTKGYVVNRCLNIDGEEDFLLLETLHRLQRVAVYGA